MSAPRRTGILGGTFDPVHLGHLSAADAARRALALDEVLFIPSHQPPHRTSTPGASMFHRFAMVSLAVAPDPAFVASDLELVRPGRSFTAVTLRRLHEAGYDPLQLFFIIGTDAFAEIATWHDYPAVLDLAHFVVISRSGESFEGIRTRLPELADRLVVASAETVAAGGAGTRVFLVNADTPEVSATEIRARARDGRPLDDLEPPAVAEHIRRHRLYSGAEDGA